jgi:hypothetical protein
MNPMHPDYESWPVQEQIRYCLARELWPIRNELTVNTVKRGEVSARIPWKDWFEMRHGIGLETYVEQLQATYRRAA